MKKPIPLILGFILLALAIWIQTTSIKSINHFITRLENLAYDMQLKTRLFTHNVPLKTSVVIVDIDDKSLHKEGRWPWSRSKVAKLIDQLREDGATVIALDVLFAEKEENMATRVQTELKKQKLSAPSLKSAIDIITPLFDNDKKLAISLSKTDSVLSVTFQPNNLLIGQAPLPVIILKTAEEKQLGFITAPGMISNIALLATAAKGAGFINAFPDEDGIIRRIPLLIRYQDKLYPSLALEAARLYWLTKINLVTAKYRSLMRVEGVKIGSYTIPTDEQGRVIIPFRGKSLTFPYVSATDVLNRTAPRDIFVGKIVFIGTTATSIGDLKATAAENIFPGVEIQATLADGILKNDFSYKPAWADGSETFLTLLLGSLAVILFTYLGPRTLSILMFAIPTVMIFANNAIWEKSGLIISIFIPMVFIILIAILNIIYGYLFETRRREQLKEMFGQYVPAKHIDEMLQSTGNYGLHGEDRDMTVLFSDIRNFTSISEQLSAAQLKEFLDLFLTPMTEVIFKHRGTVDKYIGDSIMAFWGAPLKDKKHAQHALGTALEMQQALTQLNFELSKKGLPEIAIGIGANSGIMSVGDMGSKFRRNYTVLGDAVNLASRVESLTKYYGVKIIVTEETLKNQLHFVFRQLDRVKVKGKETGVAIYEVICKLSDCTKEKKEELHQHEEALQYYFQQHWSEAYARFDNLNKAHPDTKLYHLYCHRISEFEKTPPPANWDGVHTHTTK